MTTPDPQTKNLADLYHLAPLNWNSVRDVLRGDLPQAPGTRGPDRHTFWLSTTDLDGRPHVTGVGTVVDDDRYYFCGSPQSRKIRNIERDSRCAFAVATSGYDIVLEGRAARVTDESALERLAALFAVSGWAPRVADGGFVHEFSAPSAGPPPWYVYEFVADDVYATATTELGGATRWTF